MVIAAVEVAGQCAIIIVVFREVGVQKIHGNLLARSAGDGVLPYCAGDYPVLKWYSDGEGKFSEVLLFIPRFGQTNLFSGGVELLIYIALLV